MPICDICGKPETGTWVSSEDIRQAVFANGFNPFALGLVANVFGANAAAFEQWKRTVVAQDTSDWNICPACMSTLRRYLKSAPAPTGVQAAIVSADPLVSALAAAGAEQKYNTGTTGSPASPPPPSDPEKSAPPAPATKSGRRMLLLLVGAVALIPACLLVAVCGIGALALTTAPGGPLSTVVPTVPSQSAKPGSPAPAGGPDNLVVRSYPPGLKTYVVPKSATQGTLGVLSLTKQEYLIGQTPLEVPLAPGEYVVTVADMDHATKIRHDGEDSTIEVLDEKSVPLTANTGGKSYNLTKVAGHRMLVTALFWRADQPLADLVKNLSGPAEFPAAPEVFQPIFERHQVPSSDWPLLLTMLAKTGKAVWYGSDAKQYLYSYYTELAPKYLLAERPASQ